MNARNALTLAADMLDAEDWPDEVVEAVRVVVADDERTLPPDVVAMFIHGRFDARWTDVADEVVALAEELRRLPARRPGWLA